MIEIDAELNPKAVVRRKLRRLVALGDFHRFQNTDEFFRRRLLFDPRRLQKKDEGSGAAVHDRHFGCGDIDVHIINTEPSQSRHQMLYRRNARAVLLKTG